MAQRSIVDALGWTTELSRRKAEERKIPKGANEDEGYLKLYISQTQTELGA